MTKPSPRPLSKQAHEVRAGILAALESLDAPRELLERLRKLAPGTVHHFLLPNPTRSFLPGFNPDEESPAAWKARAVAKIQVDIEEQMQEWRELLAHLKRLDVDGPVTYPKRRRRGSSQKGQISSFADRCKWAAEWLLGRSWKDIAGEARESTDRVRQGATDLLRTAGLDKSNRRSRNRE